DARRHRASYWTSVETMGAPAPPSFDLTWTKNLVDKCRARLASLSSTRTFWSETMSEATRETMLHGPVLEVLPQLLAEGRTEEVLAAFQALVSRNETLERQLAAMLHRGLRSNEGVSKDQLSLFLGRLKAHVATGENDDCSKDETKADVDAKILAGAEAAAQRAREKVIA